MDKTFVKGKVAPVSIRNGPVADDPMDVDGQTNGAPKRKSRSSLGNKPVNYKDASDDSDDGAPLVCSPLTGLCQPLFHSRTLH